MTAIETVKILRISGDKQEYLEDTVVTEFPLTILLNDEELVTTLCTPQYLDYLAVGFLASEGLLKGKQDIKKMLIDGTKGVVRVESAGETGHYSRFLFKRFITSGCGRSIHLYSAGNLPLTKVDSATVLSPQQVSSLMKTFQERCTVFKATGGVHAAALCDKDRILVFHEDIGRHNAIDKVLGQCLLDDITTEDKLLLTTGRITSELVFKATRRNIPLLISKSPPTSLAVTLAKDLGITVIGFVRGQRMNIYANEWRIITDERSGN